MRNLLISIAVVLLIFNMYSLGVWLFSYFNTANPTEALTRFLTYFPALFSINAIHWMSLIGTILSIIIFTRYKNMRTHTVFTTCIIVQAGFLMLYTWQSL